jgi:hypothetical protein
VLFRKTGKASEAESTSTHWTLALRMASIACRLACSTLVAACTLNPELLRD